MKFGPNATALSVGQLASISAADFTGFALDANGYLTATPVGGLGYSVWKATHAPATGHDPNADEDGDGVANGIEYLLGGTIGINDITKLPQISMTGGNMLITFIRDQASIDGVNTVKIEIGDNLADWPASYLVPGTGVTASPGLTVQKNLPSAGKDTVTLTLPINPGGRNFARLRVTP